MNVRRFLRTSFFSHPLDIQRNAVITDATSAPRRGVDAERIRRATFSYEIAARRCAQCLAQQCGGIRDFSGLGSGLPRSLCRVEPLLELRHARQGGLGLLQASEGLSRLV